MTETVRRAHRLISDSRQLKKHLSRESHLELLSEFCGMSYYGYQYDPGLCANQTRTTIDTVHQDGPPYPSEEQLSHSPHCIEDLCHGVLAYDLEAAADTVAFLLRKSHPNQDSGPSAEMVPHAGVLHRLSITHESSRGLCLGCFMGCVNGDKSDQSRDLHIEDCGVGTL